MVRTPGGRLVAVSLRSRSDANGLLALVPDWNSASRSIGRSASTIGTSADCPLPMLIAEELEVDLTQVRLEAAPPNEKLYGNPLLAGVQATGGSTAIRASCN